MAGQELVVTRFSCISRSAAIAVLAIFAALLLAVLLLSVDSGPVLVASEDADAGDLGLYRMIIEAMRGGLGYYQAAHAQLLANGYGTQSVFNWRLPTLSWLLSALPSLAWGQALAMLLALAGGGAMGHLLHRTGGWALAAPGVLVMMFSLAGVLAPGSVVLSEIPAGLLILLSAALYGLGHRRSGMAAGVAALLVRELAGLYVLVCIYLAWREKRHGELLAWLGLLVGYGLYFAWHYGQVQAQIEASDPAYVDGWLQFGGIGFLLATASFNGLFLLLPAWLSGMLAVSALLGLVAWPGGKGAHVVLMVFAALVVFAVIGKPFNIYWGALYTPLLSLGLAFVPYGLWDLWRSIRVRKVR